MHYLVIKQVSLLCPTLTSHLVKFSQPNILIHVCFILISERTWATVTSRTDRTGTWSCGTAVHSLITASSSSLPSPQPRFSFNRTTQSRWRTTCNIIPTKVCDRNQHSSDPLITVRKRSCGKVMFLHPSLIHRGGVVYPPPGRHHTPGRHPPADSLPTPETATTVYGTHPTGIHSS